MDRTFIDRRASEAEHLQTRQIAQAFLDGQTTVLEAASALVSLAHTDAISGVEGRRLIIAIASETDHLPIGEVRRLWAPSALEVKDVEIEEWDEFYRPHLTETCKRIVAQPQLER